MPQHIKYPVTDGRKECGDCGLFKPIAEYPKARTHYASRCRDCLRIYAAGYRQRPQVRQKTAQYHKAYRAQERNRQHLNQYARRWRKQLPRHKKDERNKQRREWAALQKQMAVDYKGGKCECCGYSGCLAAMDFHHRNPHEKDGYGTGALKSHKTFEQNKREIDKCVLVCVRCHREIHAGARSI